MRMESHLAEMKQVLQQYFLLLNGKRPMKGDLNLGGHSLIGNITKSQIPDFAHGFDSASHIYPQGVWFPLAIAGDCTLVADTWKSYSAEIVDDGGDTIKVPIYAAIFTEHWGFTPTNVRVRFGINWKIRDGIGYVAYARVALYSKTACLGYTPEVSGGSSVWTNEVSDWTDFDLTGLHWAFLRLKHSVNGVLGIQYATLFLEYRS